MRLTRVAKKVHVASKRGAIFMGMKIETPACNRNQVLYRSENPTNMPFGFDGDVTQVTCKKCIHSLLNAPK